mgnify:CR=1 FL=1
MIITIPGHFACSSFAMHRHLTAAPRAHGSARFWSWPRCARVSSFAWSTRRRNRAAPSHSCRSLLRVISALSRRPQNYYVDARFIGNGPRGQLCKMIARMIVDDGASLGGRERSTALRGKGRRCRAEAKIEICWHDRKGTVEMLLCPHEYLYRT